MTELRAYAHDDGSVTVEPVARRVELPPREPLSVETQRLLIDLQREVEHERLVLPPELFAGQKMSVAGVVFLWLLVLVGLLVAVKECL